MPADDSAVSEGCAGGGGAFRDGLTVLRLGLVRSADFRCGEGVRELVREVGRSVVAAVAARVADPDVVGMDDAVAIGSELVVDVGVVRPLAQPSPYRFGVDFNRACMFTGMVF